MAAAKTSASKHGAAYQCVQTASEWQIKTTAYPAVFGDRIFAETFGGAITITLPASAKIGDTIQIIDVAGTFDTANLIVARNGLKIMGFTQDMTVDHRKNFF